MAKKWFHDWFNSPYYHILYKQRDLEEAEAFIDNLCEFLSPVPNAKMLDIACGRGRHAIYLNKKGFDVSGIDLSQSNIHYAQQFENHGLRFFKHDMRHLFYTNYFDFALNLFTSFGYFDTERVHINALKTFTKSLKPDGRLVLDYMNSQKIIDRLVYEESKIVDGISFNINRRVLNGKIIKTIKFTDSENKYEFREEVKDFKLSDFERLFTAAGLKITQLFGDYALNNFDYHDSERLIFICEKI